MTQARSAYKPSTLVAGVCECIPPMPNGPDCAKCGKPREAPVVDVPRPSFVERQRREKIAAFWRARRVPAGSKDGVSLN